MRAPAPAGVPCLGKPAFTATSVQGACRSVGSVGVDLSRRGSRRRLTL
ncbi:MAG: hypothetical protein QXJ77_01955 [Candidatus Bathyarchaeia archaeon]